MDPSTLAAIAAPFLARGAEAFSKSAGEKLGAEVGELCQAVVDKFRGDSDAQETLALAQKKPDSKGRQSALEEVLAEKLEADPNFAAKLQRLTYELHKGGGSKTAFDQRGQTVGTQTNIDGDPKGSIFSSRFQVQGDFIYNEAPKIRLPLTRPPRTKHFTGRDEELASLLDNAYANLGETRKAIECARSALKILESIQSPHAEKVRRKLQEWEKLSDEI